MSTTQQRPRRQSSVSSTRSPRRPAAPPNPPDPPPTLLRSISSSYNDPKRERSRRELARVTSRQASRDVGRVEEGDGESMTHTPTGRSSDGLKPGTGSDRDRSGKKQAWYIRWVKVWGRGMWHDVKNRAPYYASDWTDAWNYRVVPATLVSLPEHSHYGTAIFTAPDP